MQKATYEDEVLLASEQVVDRGELPGDSDHLAHSACFAAHVVAHDACRAGVGRDQGGQYPDDGGLASAVGPKQREDLTLAAAQVHAVEGDLLSVCLPQAVHGNGFACRVSVECVHS